jgi:tetratricopeptide (TPR) repeat protein
MFVLKIISQNTDSLQLLLKNANHDTTRCTILNTFIESQSDDSVWPPYNEEMKRICLNNLKTLPKGASLQNFFLKYLATSYNNDGYIVTNNNETAKALNSYARSLKLDEQCGNIEGMASTINNIASIYYNTGNLATALNYHHKALELNRQLKNKQETAISLNNIGLIHKNLGDIPKALEFYHQSLKAMDELGDKSGMATLLNNIGGIHKNLGEPARALEYYSKGMKYYEEVHDKSGVALCMNNIGSIHKNRGDLDSAYLYYSKSLEIFESLKLPKGIANTLNNVGYIYTNRNDTKTAIEFFKKSLSISEKISDKHQIASACNNIAYALLKQNKANEALGYAERGLSTANELGYADLIRSSGALLSQIYSKTGNWKGAYEMEVLSLQMSDSINNENNRRISLQKSFQYAYGKKAAEDSVRTVEEKRVFNAQIEQEKTQRIGLYLIVALVAIFSIFMYNRFRLTRKQKSIIESQKELVEEKQKEVLDSIRYARRIQTALLPTEVYLKKILEQAKKK